MKRYYTDINTNINIDLLNENIIKKCPHCNSENIIKFGKSNGVQRYRCKEEKCRKTFVQKYNSPFKNAKKFKMLWKKYLELMLTGATIRQCAAALKITIVTAFFWRHKILSKLKDGNEISNLEEYVELTKLVHKENFKGDRSIKTTIRENINVVSAVDNGKQVVSVPVSRHYLKFDNIKEKIYSKIDKMAFVVGYQDRYLRNSAERHNTGEEFGITSRAIARIRGKIKTKPKLVVDSNGFKEIDSWYSIKIRFWLKQFKGIATKYLEHYLNWYIFNYRSVEKEYLLYVAKINNYITWESIKGIKLKV